MNVELPKDWKIVKLGEACEILDGKRKPINASERNKRIANKSDNELFPYYGATGQVGYIDDFLINGEYVLLGEDGAPFLESYKNKAYLVKGKIWVNNHAHILRSLYSNKFLCYYLNQISYREYVSGTTRLKLNQSSMRDIPVVVPPLPEQHRIVAKIEELFSDLDKGIENLKTAQTQLKTYRQAVLKYAFEGRFTNTKVKSGELPEAWKWEQFGDVTINFDGKRVPLSREVRSKRKGKYRYYGATEIVDYIDDYLFDGEYILIGEDGANLLSKSRPLAFIVEGKFWVNNHAHILQVKINLCLKYLCHYFNSLNIAHYVSGSAQPKLNQANMNKIPIPLCSIQEQQQIVQEIESRLSVCDKVEETLTASLQQSESLRQSILKKAFEGRLA